MLFRERDWRLESYSGVLVAVSQLFTCGIWRAYTFLDPIRAYAGQQQWGVRLYGFRAFANTLHLLIDFMDADGNRHVISFKALKNSCSWCKSSCIRRTNSCFLFWFPNNTKTAFFAKSRFWYIGVYIGSLQSQKDKLFKTELSRNE